MSKKDLPNKNCKQRFKGVENFLRRVSFNLGNSPSQTEVKIISCIPIDVTDLQQKIINLEKQLDETKSHAVSSAAPVVHTALCKPRFTDQCDECCVHHSKSSPSAHTGKPAPKRQPLAECACYSSDETPEKGDRKRHVSKSKHECACPKKSKHACECSNNSKVHRKQKKSKTECACISPKSSKKKIIYNPNKECECYSVQEIPKGSISKRKISDSECACLSFTDFPKGSRDSPCACDSTDDNLEVVCKVSRKGLFKKSKKKAKKRDKKLKTQFVYYAQTTTGPFNDYLETRTPNKSPTRRGETMSRTYISEMIRKQYAPVPIAQEMSTTSQFSSPVCRDVDQPLPISNPYESDLCSCCHGTFHNIDHHMATHNYTDVLNTFPAFSYKECMNNASFYDSSLYDMVPVREKPTRTAASCYEKTKRKIPKMQVNATYRPEKIISKTRFQPLIISNSTKSPPVINNTKRSPVKSYNKKEKVLLGSCKPGESNHVRLKQPETSTSCCIDCGNVYMKRIHDNSKLQPPAKPDKSASCKNAECLTCTLNDTECQTTTTQSVQIDQNLLEEKKTEETLNQIKSILQSVLTEVKTNTQLKKTSQHKDKSTKDAVVQKGTSQGNMPGCSSLLHSFTYSPYNMNPFVASCSRQMTSGPCCFQNLPYPSAKCMQNFPVFIQTPGRHMCASCYRNSSHIPKAPQPKPAATAATNTDSKERSKETEKLIKEIYKSMAVNMEFPTKDTSASEYNDLKSTPRVSVNRSLYRPSVLDEGMKKFMKANASKNLQKSSTPITTMNSKLMSNTLSMRSQIVSTTDTERNIRNSRIEKYLENIDANKKRQNKIEEEREYEEASPDTTASDDDEVSYTEASVRESYVQKVEEPVKKPKPDKKGLFSKMLNSVKLFNGKNKKTKKKEEEVQVENEVDEESDGNSDDYQTIYSQRVDRRPRYVPHAVRSPYRLKAHSKISYSRHMRDRNQERSKRPPYMEQEYRRHWNERLMFQDNRHRYSSDSPFSKETPIRARDPVYWRDYEARSALIDSRATSSRVPAPGDRQKFTRNDLLQAINNGEEGVPKPKVATRGLAWLKKNIRCGEQWKKFILEG